jgi:hypothetical protein
MLSTITARRSSRVLPVFVAMTACATVAGATGTAPVSHDVGITSLYRADPTWEIVTSFNMSADDVDGTAWTFALVHPEALMDADGKTPRVTCVDQSGTNQLAQIPTGAAARLPISSAR